MTEDEDFDIHLDAVLLNPFSSFANKKADHLVAMSLS